MEAKSAAHEQNTLKVVVTESGGGRKVAEGGEFIAQMVSSSVDGEVIREGLKFASLDVRYCLPIASTMNTIAQFQ
jgi:hypothetical protein